ncbi:MAG: DUF1549 domain-containing protein, partial [Verrucomicrobiota bacterium]
MNSVAFDRFFGRVATLSIALAIALPSLCNGAVSPGKGKKTVNFNNDIRPILSEYCFACHGPDEKARKAKLRFDLKEEAFKPAKSGDPAIVPGSPEKSSLIARITSTDPDEVMPPPETKKNLSPAHVEMLRRWIAEGAEWAGHWAYEKPERPEVPKVKAKRWPRNELDHFVLKRLENEGLKPAPEADKPTLARRAALDLTGLPPSIEEVDQFLADKSPDAYEKLVDRLLASPRYGEHQAKSWLDAARYADSHGYHIDSQRDIWAYREWVIRAFNENKPFDQFTIEQLAGDLLPDASVEQKIASGYIRCNMSTGEGGAIEAEYAAKYAFDRTETTGTIWMGLTLLCSRCHTHKYDPIQQKEYYGLLAFFNNLNEPVMDGNRPNPDPFVKLPSKEQSARLDWLRKHIAEGQGKIDGPAPELDTAQTNWVEQWHTRLSKDWAALRPAVFKSTVTNGAQLKQLDDGSILAEGSNPEQDVYELTIPLQPGALAAVRLEALPHESLPNKAIGRADDGKFRLSEFEAELLLPGPEGKTNPPPQKLKFTQAVADAAEGDNAIDRAIDGKAETAWGTDASTEARHAVFVLGEPLAIPDKAELRIRLRHEATKSKNNLGRFRLAAAQSPELVRWFNPPRFEEWKVVGPFKSEGLHAGYEKVYEPEKEIDLKKSYPGVREEIRWNGRGDLADGKNHLFVNELHGVHGVFYAHRVIHAPSDLKMEFTLRADDLFKVWLNGQLVHERSTVDNTNPSARFTVDLKKGENKLLVKVVNHQGAKYFAFNKALEGSESLPADIAAILATTQKLSGSNFTKVRNHYRRSHSAEFRQTFENVEKWREEEGAIDRAIPTTMVAKEAEKRRDTFLLMRGEYDKPADKISPGVPAILPPFPADAPTNRLGLAKWLLHPDHPLTARVTVNRLWQQFFGVGLVKTSDDFGVQGERPSHPDLLDWLATEFIRTGWDVKRLQKMIVMSATYRQTSKASPELRARDPENRLLARGPRFRVDGEVVRDLALYVSGLLSEKQG